MTITDNETRKPNRLLKEKSPYLLQHAYNPVDWYPWSEEAFEVARREDKPIFLSIGYSTCHWCHVMGEESFADQDVANLLNQNYISIKVDREERPDIDHIYMSACQALTGSGGWPLTIIMGADKKPFYAATYLPRSSRGNLWGMLELLPHVAGLWETEREHLTQAGESISQHIIEGGIKQTGMPIDEELLQRTFEDYLHLYDRKWGGFGSAPKFPVPHNLLFLLRYYHFKKEGLALEMVEKTLQSMYQGGIYDHIGFGFSRYSTDNEWLVPHFEKMLYDNALLALAYLECYQLTNEDFYAGVAQDIFSYILRDMSGTDGGFYSAEDADSEGEEGKYYLWDMEEIKQVLGEDALSWINAYGISPGGNFQGKNIPNLINRSNFADSRRDYAAERRKLFEYREKRIKPFKDDKVLTGWNGLMIAALAKGARILGDESYLRAACRAADFIRKNLRRADGRLLARYREGEAGYPAYAADYAYYIWGLLELYQASFDGQYLVFAMELSADLIKYFWDEEGGGFFFYGIDAEQLLTRPKDGYDGATPSYNAVAAYSFMLLARLTADLSWQEKAQRAMDFFAAQIRQHPTAHAFWLLAAIQQIFPGSEVVVAAEAKNPEALKMLELLNSSYDPHRLIMLNEEKNNELLGVPFLQNMLSLDGKPTAYICENFACREPLIGVDMLMESGYISR